MSQETVFIVDDDPSNLSILFGFLEAAGFEVLIGMNGKSAIETIRRTQPDIILLDVVMPGIDGFDVAAILKADEATWDIPIIFMTALADEVNKEKGLALGAIDYVTKPVHVKEFIVRLKSHLTVCKLQKALDEKDVQLQEALNNVNTLRRLLPICSKCKSIRDDKAYLNQLEEYMASRPEAFFRHTRCQKCSDSLSPDAQDE